MFLCIVNTLPCSCSVSGLLSRLVVSYGDQDTHPKDLNTHPPRIATFSYAHDVLAHVFL